jgi:MoaA/NifB/PqqE/SkfB family radical SAM enzyme
MGPARKRRALASPAAVMDYSIEADWQLLNTCNFRCGYCLSPNHLLGEKLRAFASPSRWSDAFDATRRTWLLHLTGGEPGLYPDFVEFCRTLTQRHFISLNTNLTHPSYQRFAERIDPARVSFINAGLHLEERESRSGEATLLKNAERLLAAGFPLMVSLVATPAALARFDEAVAMLAPIGLYPIPKLLRGSYLGGCYPDAYSDLDRRRFRARAAEARAYYDGGVSGRSPTINMFADDDFLEGVPVYVGRACAAGSRFVRIEPNGDVFRCSTKTALGNLLDGSLSLLPGPTPCDTGYCFYWCEKYASKPETPRPGRPDWIAGLRRRLTAPARLRRHDARV